MPLALFLLLFPPFFPLLLRLESLFPFPFFFLPLLFLDFLLPALLFPFFFLPLLFLVFLLPALLFPFFFLPLLFLVFLLPGLFLLFPFPFFFLPLDLFAGSALQVFLTAAFSQPRAELPLSMIDGTLEASSSVSASPASLFLLDPKSPFQLAHLSMFPSNSVLVPDSRPVKSPLMASSSGISTSFIVSSK